MQPTILVSITGYGKEYKDRSVEPWQNKLKEIEKFGIKEIALFLELYDKKEKQEIYRALLKSGVRRIPLVHIRHDMEKSELEFLKKNYKTQYFTIHEINFADEDLKKWKGLYKNIYLEMNCDGIVSKKVDVSKIGGFCIDFAHFKVDMEKLNKDFEYVFKRKDIHKYFKCNHLNGYNPEKNIDIHTIYNLKNFDYLKTLPQFVFGKTIALETFNSIKEQLEFKKYLTALLSEKPE